MDILRRRYWKTKVVIPGEKISETKLDNSGEEILEVVTHLVVLPEAV